jgi:hypothetical protein
MREFFPILLIMVAGISAIGYPLARAFARRIECGGSSRGMSGEMAAGERHS